MRNSRRSSQHTKSSPTQNSEQNTMLDVREAAALELGLHPKPAPHLGSHEATHGQTLLATSLLHQERPDKKLSHHRHLQAPSDMRTISSLAREPIRRLHLGQSQQKMMELRHDERHMRPGQKCEVERRLLHITPMGSSQHQARMRGEAPDSKPQSHNHHRFQRETATRLEPLAEMNQLPRIPPHIIHNAQGGRQPQNSNHRLRRPRQEPHLWTP